MKVTHLITISVLFLSLILLSTPPIAPDAGFHKVWNEETQTISIISPTGVTQMTIRLISSEPDLCTFTEIFEITNFKAFTPSKNKDFKVQTVKHKGNKSVTLAEWFIEQNVSYTVNITDYKVVQVEKEIYNNKTGKNKAILVNETVIAGYHDETRYKNVWSDYKPHGKPMAKDMVQLIKVVYHKSPEIGDVRIQTIPMFRGVECDELTWWNGSWNKKREIKIDNTGGSALSYYQVYVNLTDNPINSTSLRVSNETADATVPHWQENITSGNCYDTWFNVTSIPASTWLNGTYYIYYNNAAAATASDGTETFPFFEDWDNLNDWTTRAGSPSVSGSELTLNVGGGGHEALTHTMVFPESFSVRMKAKYNSAANDARWYLLEDEWQDVTDSGPYVGWLNGDIKNYDGAWHDSNKNYVTDVYDIIEMRDVDDTAYTFDLMVDDVSGAANPAGFRNDKAMGMIGLAEYVGTADFVSDWIFVRKYASPEPTTTLGAEESCPITVTLLSQTPSTIYQNTTGNLNISYGISHGSVGLNNTSVSFIFRNYDHTLNDANHSIRPPANNKSVMWNYDGQIIRAANRNETLNFENNDTITGGNIYTWSGLDENQTRLTIVPVNSTYTIVHVNGTVHDLAMEQMWYLDRTDMIDAPKTQLAIHKSQDVLVKFWDAEIFKGNYNFIGAGYTDTSLNSAPALQPSDANPVSFYYLNSSYDPLGGVDPLDSEYAVYMGSLNVTQWVDHTYSPGQNASYVRGLINNTVLHSVINTTEISYLYFKSNTPTSKPYYINITDASTITNRTFGQTDVLWIGDTAPYTAHPYTPNVWFAFIYGNTSFDHKLYVADNDGVWGNSTLQSTNIGKGLFDPTTPYIDHFHFDGTVDYDMNHTYSGTIEVGVGVGTDPDGGTVTHNLTLHYANRTFVAIINNTFTDADIIHNGVYADISFNTIPYYSETEEYTLKVVATDDEGATSRSWSCCNFTLRLTPVTPTNLTHTKGDTWVNHTWDGGPHTDSFNVSINGTWYNDTTNEFYNNTGLSSGSWSNIIVWAYNTTYGYLSTSSVSENVQIPAAEEKPPLPTVIPTSIFTWLLILLFGMMTYTLHTSTHIQKIFGGMITTIMAFMLSQQIVSGNVVTITTKLNSTDIPVTNKTEMILPDLSYLLLFVATIMSLITMIFFIKYVIFLYDESQKNRGGLSK